MSAQKIKQLRAQRNTDIHRVKELKTIADRALVERDIHAHFKMRYKHLDLVFDDFEKQHTALIALLSVDETANLDPETQLFENDVSVNNQTHIVEESFTRSVNVKLPKIEIPKFDDRIDSDTVTKFEMSLPPDTAVPAFQVLVDFLNKKCNALETVSHSYQMNTRSGFPSIEEALVAQSEIIRLLNKGGFELQELSLLSKLQICRQLITESYLHCELHGFCDASEKGFAAVVYFRVLVDQTNIKTFFSKVAPLKRVTLPRLELCAAVLLSDLLDSVKNTYNDKINFTWTDSSVTLAWIKSSPHRWHTFVSNRISHIQDKVSPCQWFHVMSHDNPADCASRGLLPSELIHHPLWWAGPPWLSDHRKNWPDNILNISSSPPETSQEEKKNIFITCLTFDMQLDKLVERYSTLSKISRIISYVLRFANNCRQRKQDRNFGAPTLSELDKSVLIFVKHSQHSSFFEEISRLQSGKLVPRWLRKLNPFLDDMGVLRVGGRLIKSDLSYERKHPALLQSKHKLTTLIIEYTHRIYLHPGLQTLQFLLAQRYWIRAPKRTIRRVLASCYKCWRVNPSSPQPPMGNLPAARISQLLQRLHQHFWCRWRNEYLHTLLQRSKWYDHATPILPNTMVVLKDDLTPPLRWLLGRVDAIHPGADGVTRVVTVRTAKGERHLVQVSGACPLDPSRPTKAYHRREYQSVSKEFVMIKLTVLSALFVAALGAVPQLRSVPHLDGRIVGGENADISDYSYQLSLLFLGSHICGAATISPTWALTAAHCLDSTVSSLFLSVRAGSSIRNSGGEVVSVAETRQHPEYRRTTLDYDIATLRLSSAIGIATSQAIPLPSPALKPPAGLNSVITGWGATSEGGSSANVLQVVEVPIINQAVCRNAYSVSAVTDRMFCAGLLGVGGKDACQGDSGGPVAVNGVLVGLVSWGYGCARPESPGVYTSVPALRDWILEETSI
ncbi:hypothetical protein NQ317_004285 [Molorchus minor]|uniref:Peptidase S1 domain-containing protein n=1 Tax=Molorchus minor TaxID=1323400 RepID=A0ABQ9JGL1_9CUCU|nr:hypothetical protein NQ317_004285 [Molorchus minor]